MTDLDAILTIENNDAATEEDLIAAWQHLITSGTVWELQGSYQRGAYRLISNGTCTI